MSWAPVTGATGYDVVRGALSTLLAGAGNFTSATDVCVGPHVSGTSLANSHVPTAGDADWLLIRGYNPCGVGTYDDGAPSQVGSRDAGIAASPNACP